MVATAYFKWGCTFRPTDGVTDDNLKTILRWVQRDVKSGRLTGGFIASEMIDEKKHTKHLHMGFEFAKATYKAAFIKSFVTALKPRILTPDEYAVLNNKDGTKPWYNEDFYSNYCTKTFLPCDEKPWSEQCEWFLPWDPELYPPPDDESGKKPMNVWYADRKREYLAANLKLPATEESCYHFVYALMVVHNKIRIIEDPVILKRKCLRLVDFINGTFCKYQYSQKIKFDSTDPKFLYNEWYNSTGTSDMVWGQDD